MNLFKRISGRLKRNKMQRLYAAYEAYRDGMLSRLPPNSVGAEIGTWKGDYARRMITIAQPCRLHLIDPYIFFEEYPDRWYGGLEAKSQPDMDKIFEAVKHDLTELAGDKTEVIFHRDLSAKAIQELADDSLDWAYVDGNHSYEYVKRDIEDLIPKLKVGGLLMGDDLQWKSISRAVNEVLQEKSDKLTAVSLSLESHQYILRKL
jgi:hypothetical protein